jgi:hypothetical protein
VAAAAMPSKISSITHVAIEIVFSTIFSRELDE